jgi:Domain of unknown function DUF11
MRRTLRLIGLAAAAVSVVGLTASAAAPVRTWHTDLGVSTNAALAAGALTAHGDAIASGEAMVAGRWRVEVATRHGFAAPWALRQLTGNLAGSTNTTSAADDAGAATVLWRAPGAMVNSAVRGTRTGAWKNLTVPSGASARGNDGFFQATSAMTSTGQTTVLWYAHEQHGWVIRSAFRSGTNAAWRATPALVPTAPVGSNVVGVQLAGDAAGDAVAVWSIVPNGSRAGTVVVALRSAHKAWRAPVAIASAEFATAQPGATPSSVAIAPNGRVALAWGALVPPGPTTTRVTIATGNAVTGSWTSPVAVAAGGQPRVAIDSAGALAAVWSDPVTDVGGYDVKGAVAPDGATWTTPDALAHIGVGSESDSGHVALSESGHAFAAVSVHVGPGAYTAAVGSADAGGAWSGYSRDSGGPSGVTFASNAAGDALALRTPNGTFADSYDAIARPFLMVTIHGAWLAGRHRLRWTITITNRGMASAASVHLTATSTNARIVQTSPTVRASSRSGRRWSLGTIARGHARTVTLTVASTRATSAPVLRGQSSAPGLPPVTVNALAPR